MHQGFRYARYNSPRALSVFRERDLSPSPSLPCAFTSLTRGAQEPRAFVATAAGADRSRDARGATGCARDRVFVGTYPEVVRTALRTHEPSGVVAFAFRLAHAISSAWETVVVKGEADVERACARVWLYLCARDVLGAAKRLLSIGPLKRMWGYNSRIGSEIGLSPFAYRCTLCVEGTYDTAEKK